MSQEAVAASVILHALSLVAVVWWMTGLFSLPLRSRVVFEIVALVWWSGLALLAMQQFS